MALDRILGTSLEATSNASNVIMVTANTGSMVNTNTVNFINSSSVKVTVEEGSNGRANVSFTAPVSLGLLIALSGD
jgi:hypothetical protein